MARRRLLCGLLLLSAVLACFAGWLVMASGARVTTARFHQVEKGMSREEVIRVVGGPPGDYSNGRRVSLLAGNQPCENWLSEDGELLVDFDDAGTVTVVRIVDTFPSLTERLRRWLGL
jgi:hypothetical protein